MKQTAHHQRATPVGHKYPTKSKWTSPRDSKWPSHPESQVPHQAEPASMDQSDMSQAVPLHCPRHCLRKYTSSGQSEHALHSIPGRKTLLQEKNIHILQRKKFFSHVSTSSMC